MPASSTMGASASRTTPLRGRSEVLPWADAPGCSPAPTAAAGAPQPCIPSSALPSSTMSIRRLGSLTFSAGSREPRRTGSTNFFPGIGFRSRCSIKPHKPAPAQNHPAPHALAAKDGLPTPAVLGGRIRPEALEIRVNMGAPVGHMFRTDATEEITDNETLLPSRSDSPCHPVQAPGTRFMDGVTEDSGTEPHPVRRVCPCKARPRLESRACQELTSRRSSLSSIPAEHASRVSGVLSQSAVVAGVSAARHRRPFPVRGRLGPART